MILGRGEEDLEDMSTFTSPSGFVVTTTVCTARGIGIACMGVVGRRRRHHHHHQMTTKTTTTTTTTTTTSHTKTENETDEMGRDEYDPRRDSGDLDPCLTRTWLGSTWHWFHAYPAHQGTTSVRVLGARGSRLAVVWEGGGDGARVFGTIDVRHGGWEPVVT